MKVNETLISTRGKQKGFQVHKLQQPTQMKLIRNTLVHTISPRGKTAPFKETKIKTRFSIIRTFYSYRVL